MIKVGFISLGCPKNLVDSEVMLGHLRLKGFTLTHSMEEAEVLVINTCAFIEPAKQESIEAILEAAAMKQTGACRKLIVAGCLVERYRDELLADMPEIDACIGTRISSTSPKSSAPMTASSSPSGTRPTSIAKPARGSSPPQGHGLP